MRPPSASRNRLCAGVIEKALKENEIKPTVKLATHFPKARHLGKAKLFVKAQRREVCRVHSAYDDVLADHRAPLE